MSRLSSQILRTGSTVVALSLSFASLAASTDLSDQPIAASQIVPGNLVLPLSVEYPTAVSVANTNRTYTPATEYLGYFDPNKCYTYLNSSTDSTVVPNTSAPASYFYPIGSASSHLCSGQWSGNFLNWAATQTIDGFRWVLTGGYRVIDTQTLSVLEKAWASGQGGTGEYPDATVAAANLPGATPFPSSAGNLFVQIQGLGNRMRFYLPANNFAAQFYNNTSFSGTPVLTRSDQFVAFNFGTNSPSQGTVNSTNYSATWTATVTAPTTGSYTFQLSADTATTVTLDGKTVKWTSTFTAGQSQTSRSYTLTGGTTHTIVVQYAHTTGNASIYLNWMTPSTSNTYIPVNSGIPYPGSGYLAGVGYDVFVRAKVCDPSSGGVLLEANCTAYGSNYKPEGLLQQYSNKIRFSVISYLNDSNFYSNGSSYYLRDGGVLRAGMKFVGPTQPVPGQPAITNPLAEWSATTGVYTVNPNASDASSTGYGAADSGVVNYLNKFGEAAQTFKGYDDVSELYYAAIRYYKNQGNVPEWSVLNGTTAQNTGFVDGFPVITNWVDPILYSCQRNFILGIGDVNTWADANLPKTPPITTYEPALESTVQADTTVDAVVATNKIGALEAASSDASVSSYSYVSGAMGSIPVPWCCGNTNVFNMAGLAYDAHTVDMRPNDFKNANGTKSYIQTASTYWVDVEEYSTFQPYNQFWMAAKYGGFTVPANYSPYTATTPPANSTWFTTGDMIDGSANVSKSTSGTFQRPDHYFPGNSPAAMRTGLIAAFADIASSISAASTAFSFPSPKLQATGNLSYPASYAAATWSGNVQAAVVNIDSSGNPTATVYWNARDTLTSQSATVNGVNGWDTGRIIATSNAAAPSTGKGVPFRLANLSTVESTALTALATTAQTLLNYLRGDASNEGTLYRTRTYRLGDIVDSKTTPVGPPSAAYSDSTNLGYASFKSSNASRPTVVYVGANDGMMHAFDGSITDGFNGKELFAYVPSFLYTGPTATPAVNGLASLANTAFVHHFFVDATPYVIDIDFNKVNTSLTPSTSDWHSVLIGGLGKGGMGYYALDVTSPQTLTNETALAGKVLWEFTDPRMGYSYGPPVVAKTKKYGWVVVFTSGYNNNSGIGGANGGGYLFIVNPKTGALLEAIATGAGTVANPSGLAYATAFIPDYTDFTTDSVYAGDLLGNLWRFDLTGTSGTYPAPTQIAQLTDSSGNLQPVTTQPLVEVEPKSLQRYVIVGTGRLLGVTDSASSALQSIYAIRDGTRTAFSTTGVTYPITRANLTNDTNSLLTGVTTSATQGFYIDLGISSTGIAQRIVTNGIDNSGIVAFAALQSNGDPCSPTGTSSSFGFKLSSGQSVLTVNGVLVASITTAGAPTDLSFLNVAGRIRLELGNDQNATTNLPGNFDGLTGGARLNWREIPLRN